MRTVCKADVSASVGGLLVIARAWMLRLRGLLGVPVAAAALWCCAAAVANSGGAPVRDKVISRRSDAPVFSRTLRKGQTGADIVTLQTWLADVGYRIPATGYFGRMTKHAVRRFQLSHRLYPASGSVGDRTSATLLAAVARAGDRPVAPPRPPAPRHATVPAIAGPGGRDPIPGFSIGRDDMGVDASARVGTAIYAPVASRLVQVLRGWYAGQPLLLFKFLSPPAGVLSDFWYVAEQVAPVTTAIGTTFRAGEPVGTYASSGTGIEIGWGSPTSNARTLADVTDPGASSPSGKTVWGESFKKFFGIP